MSRAFRQGDLNGLCGLYAVVNAINRHLEVRLEYDFNLNLFAAVAAAVPRKDFPEFLWEGLEIQSFLKLAKAAASHLYQVYGFKVDIWRPFINIKLRNVSHILSEIENMWNKDVTTFSLSIQWPGNQGGHWTVLDWISDREIGFRDTCTAPIRRVDLGISSSRKHIIDPADIVAFRLLSIGGTPIDAPA